MIAIATAIAAAVSTLFGIVAAEPKAAPASDPPCCGCAGACAAAPAEADLKPSESQLNPNGGPVYVCPMHPDVLSEKPGLCPKCNMKLEPKPSVLDERSYAIIDSSSQWERGFFAVAGRWSE